MERNRIGFQEAPRQRNLIEKEQQPLGTLANGEKVFDRSNSHLHVNVELLREALSRIVPNDDLINTATVPFERTLGLTNCVETAPGDEIVFAQRKGRFGLTRFVKNKSPTPSTKLTVVLKRIENNAHIVLTAYIGEKAEKEPWDKYATEESKVFWKNHALAWGEEEIVEGTETDLPPKEFIT